MPGRVAEGGAALQDLATLATGGDSPYLLIRAAARRSTYINAKSSTTAAPSGTATRNVPPPARAPPRTTQRPPQPAMRRWLLLAALLVACAHARAWRVGNSGGGSRRPGQPQPPTITGGIDTKPCAFVVSSPRPASRHGSHTPAAGAVSPCLAAHSASNPNVGCRVCCLQLAGARRVRPLLRPNWSCVAGAHDGQCAGVPARRMAHAAQCPRPAGCLTTLAACHALQADELKSLMSFLQGPL